MMPEARHEKAEHGGFSEHQVGQGPAFHRHACQLGLEGIVSKRLDAPYSPGDRGLWVKTKRLNRDEFVVAGWTDPEGSGPLIGALLLGYYDAGGRLVYAGRVGTGMRADHLADHLKDLLRRLQPLQTEKMPFDLAPPRSTRFGSPLVLSGTLGPARARRRSQISNLDRGRAPAPGRL